MTITAKVIADSISPQGHRLTTMQLRYPRFIHAEAKTHRVMSIDDAEYEFLQEISFMDDPNLSRNASSSRAVPVERMIQDVLDDPAMPVEWGSNKPGMQAGEECTNAVNILAQDDAGEFQITGVSPQSAWLDARSHAVRNARAFAQAGYHKQIANRLLEPFAHISVVCTATEWDNFFALRCHPAADPTMRALAEAMLDAREASEPRKDNWHLPYVGWSDHDWADEQDARDDNFQMFNALAMISAARCARVSYLNHDGSNPDIEKDLALAKRLLESRHMSPSEHQARVTRDEGTALWGNFTGWDQHRKMIEALQ